MRICYNRKRYCGSRAVSKELRPPKSSGGLGELQGRLVVEIKALLARKVLPAPAGKGDEIRLTVWQYPQ
ncbi:MAG: hypothetical protein CMJ81_08145 [Planctomycetaceae bacterium]|nr:hypothetical protein [Planctomycetaceae bacterium]